MGHVIPSHGHDGPGSVLFVRRAAIGFEHEVRAVSEAGETMPEKSTYFYPKIATGLVFNPLED